jgi:hypothetical protein
VYLVAKQKRAPAHCFFCSPGQIISFWVVYPPERIITEKFALVPWKARVFNFDHVRNLLSAEFVVIYLHCCGREGRWLVGCLALNERTAALVTIFVKNVL